MNYLPQNLSNLTVKLLERGGDLSQYLQWVAENPAEAAKEIGSKLAGMPARIGQAGEEFANADPGATTEQFTRGYTFTATTMAPAAALGPEARLAAVQPRRPTAVPRGTAPPASSPVGRLSRLGGEGAHNPQLRNAPFQQVRNAPATINGRQFSGHALDQMQNRGLTPTVVENAIGTGQPFATRPGTTGVFDPVNRIRVILNSETGQVVTVIPGAP